MSEDIEELRSEKVMLPRSLDCADDAAMGDLKKDIAAMEAALKKLDEHEEEPRSVRERLRNLQQEQTASPQERERPGPVNTRAAPNQRCCPAFLFSVDYENAFSIFFVVTLTMTLQET